MPDGKPENVFGFDGAYKDPEFAAKVFIETWFKIVWEKWNFNNGNMTGCLYPPSRWSRKPTSSGWSWSALSNLPLTLAPFAHPLYEEKIYDI